MRDRFAAVPEQVQRKYPTDGAWQQSMSCLTQGASQSRRCRTQVAADQGCCVTRCRLVGRRSWCLEPSGSGSRPQKVIYPREAAGCPASDQVERQRCRQHTDTAAGNRGHVCSQSRDGAPRTCSSSSPSATDRSVQIVRPKAGFGEAMRVGSGEKQARMQV